jgi:hypothetical protein
MFEFSTKLFLPRPVLSGQAEAWVNGAAPVACQGVSFKSVVRDVGIDCRRFPYLYLSRTTEQ